MLLLPLAADSDLVETVVVTVAVAAAVDVVAVAARPKYAQLVLEELWATSDNWRRRRNGSPLPSSAVS